LWRFVAGYLTAVLLFLLLWHVCPPVALGLFLLLSWLHWGQGDYDYLRLFEGRPRPTTWGGAAIIWLVRGGLPIVLPILAFPSVFTRLGANITHWYGGIGLPAPGRGVIVGGLFVLLLLTLLSLWQSWQADGGPKRMFRRDLWELLLLWTLFGRVPPILAVGAYFCVWHSARHLGRLMLLDPVTADLIALGRWERGLGRTALQCLPMTLGAIALLVGLYFSQRHGPASLPALTALYLSLIAALTVPHFAVVLWMDRRQGL
jgi:Brp/Blh family beta-carotene 15,15'-monooxygenase